MKIRSLFATIILFALVSNLCAQKALEMYYKADKVIKELNWNRDISLSELPACPEEFKDSEAVILYKLQSEYFDYKYAYKAGDFQWNRFKRTFTQVNSQLAIEENSVFVLEPSSLYRIKMHKKNGETISFSDEDYVEEGREYFRKLVFPNLEKGDVIEILQYTFRNVDIKFQSAQFYFVDKYPIVEHELKIRMRKGLMNVTEYNEVPAVDSGVDEKGVWSHLDYKNVNRKLQIDNAPFQRAEYVYPSVSITGVANTKGAEKYFEQYMFDPNNPICFKRDKDHMRSLIAAESGKMDELDELKYIYKDFEYKMDTYFSFTSKEQSFENQLEYAYHYLRSQNCYFYGKSNYGQLQYEYPSEIDKDYAKYSMPSTINEYGLLCFFLLKNGINYREFTFVNNEYLSLEDVKTRAELGFGLSFEYEGVNYLMNMSPNRGFISKTMNSVDHLTPNLITYGAYIHDEGEKDVDEFKYEDYKVRNELVTEKSLSLNSKGATIIKAKSSFSGEYKREAMTYFYNYPSMIYYSDVSRFASDQMLKEKAKASASNSKIHVLSDSIKFYGKGQTYYSSLLSMMDPGLLRSEDLDTLIISGLGIYSEDTDLQLEYDYKDDQIFNQMGQDRLLKLEHLLSKSYKIDDIYRERKANIYMPYPLSETQIASISIGGDVTVEGIEALNNSIKNEVGEFYSKVSYTDGSLNIETSIKINKSYASADEWDKYLELLDAAYDLTQKKLLLKANGS